MGVGGGGGGSTEQEIGRLMGNIGMGRGRKGGGRQHGVAGGVQAGIGRRMGIGREWWENACLPACSLFSDVHAVLLRSPAPGVHHACSPPRPASSLFSRRAAHVCLSSYLRLP